MIKIVPATLLACSLFFASGALGLGYQLVWIKKATLIVGGSQLALSTVVTSFFIGLAFGSLFVGRHLRSRRWSPLVVYALFEVAIGLFALAFPYLFDGLESAYSALFERFSGSATSLFGLRFALLFVFFLVPTFFMGGTLPLLLDGLVAQDRSLGSQSSFLYGLNTAGAVVGVLVTGYWAVPNLGMNATSVVAGIGNLSIGLIAWIAFRRTPPLHFDDDPAGEGAGPARTRAASPKRLFLAMSFLSGFAALGYQMAWARYFSLFTPASVYFTSVLLAVYLLALSTGSLILAWLLKLRFRPLDLIAWTQPLVPVVALALLPWWALAHRVYELDGDPGRYLALPTWGIWSDTVDAIFWAPALQVLLVLFVPVLLLGLGLPAMIAAATRRSGALRSSAGSLVFWNTMGSSLGGFVAGYLLIPGLGLSQTLLVLAGVSIGIACMAERAAFLEERSSAAKKTGPGGGDPAWLRPGVIIAVVAMLFVWRSSGSDISTETIMEFGAGQPPDRNRLVEKIEGPVTTAFVIRTPNSQLLGAGNVRLATGLDEGLSGHALQGALPALLYPRPGSPRDVLGIALGSGQTFGALLLHPIERMDVVDISPEIIELSLGYFGEYQHGLGTDPRVAFHLDDGRHFVARAEDASYDIVSTEPPPPTDAGVHVLYSQEFYQQVHRILRDGGVLQNWLPLNLITPDDLRGMLKTAASVFPYTFVVKYGAVDFGILSFKVDAPPRFERQWLEERVERFRAERGAKGYRWPDTQSVYTVDSAEGIVSLILTGPDEIAALDFDLIHREDDQRLGYSSGDRWLLRRYQYTPFGVHRVSFAALPMTPVPNLQRYFDWKLPVAEIAEDRAAGLRPDFIVPSPSALAEKIARWETLSSPVARSHAALEIASIYDAHFAKADAYAWVARAIAAGGHSIAIGRSARRIAANGVGVYAEPLREFLASLDEGARRSRIAKLMGLELDAYDAWNDQRRRGLWFE